jgi:hypothetical protein
VNRLTGRQRAELRADEFTPDEGGTYRYRALLVVLAIDEHGRQVGAPLVDESLVAVRRLPLRHAEVPAVVREVARRAITHNKEQHP